MGKPEANARPAGSPKVDYVIAGLVKRRAHVAGEIEHPHEYLRKLLANLESLGAKRLVQQGPNDPDHTEHTQAGR